jgi:hypothetical protein
VCYLCYRRQLSTSTAAAAAKTIESTEYRELYEAFARYWIDATKPDGLRPAGLKRHAEVFVALSSLADRPTEIEVDLFFQAFSPHQVAKAHMSISWLRKQGYLTFLTVDSLTEESARLSQAGILRRTPAGWRRSLLGRYLTYLQEYQAAWQRRGWTGAHQRLVSRTITTALRAAHFFIRSSPDTVVAPQGLDQEMLDRFLVQSPGSLNSLRQFVTFLNRKEKLFKALVISADQSPFAAHLLLPSVEASRLIAKWTTSSETEDRNSLLLLFMLVYARTTTQACKLKRGDFGISRQGVVTVNFGRVPIELDDETARILTRYLDRLEATRGRRLLVEDYIFPGRIEGHHFKPASLGHVMGLNHVSGSKLFATALAEAYRAGLKIPKVLVRSLGICDHTALTYSQSFAPRVSEEIAQRAGRR